MRLSLALGTLLLSSSLAQAKLFQTNFVKIQLPNNWNCRQEELDWVCQPDNVAERSEVILVVVTKAVNAVDDTWEKYQVVLNTPREMRDPLGKAYKSQIRYVRKREIKTWPWIDSLQLGPEIPGWYTRYVASMKEKIAVLITYSIAESTYAKWSPIMDSVIESTEIHFDPKAFADAMNSRPGSLLANKGSLKGRLSPNFEDPNTTKGASSGIDPAQIAGGLIVAGAIGYLIWKKRKKQS